MCPTCGDIAKNKIRICHFLSYVVVIIIFVIAQLELEG